MNKKSDLFSRICTEFDLLIPEKTKGILCGFSGGADSAALLCLLIKYRSYREQCGKGTFSIYAAHIHHGIRGAEADRDEAFCSDFCQARAIPISTARVNVPEYAAEHKLGMEEAARTLRYRELNRLCTEQGADLLAVAHNATDQLETVLMHLARGSGLDGLCGMRKKSSGLIRPLLSLSKKEILAWCNENEIPYMEDSSNSDQTYTRNFVRQTILPAIHRLNPRAEDAAAVAAAALDLDRDCLDRLAAEHRLSDGRASLCALHDAILLRVIRREFQEGFRDAPMLTSLQCRAALEAIRGGKSPIRVTLPGGGELFCDRNEVVIRKKKGDPVFPSFDPLLLKEGWQSFDNENGMILLRRGILSEYDRENIAFFQNIYNFANTMSFNSAKINGDIYLRTRKASDSYFDGLHTRDVRKLLQSTHLPLAVRARYPIVCDEHGILWIPGFPARGDTSDEVEDPIQIFCFFEKKNRSCP